MNRADTAPSSWARTLREAPGLPTSLLEAVTILDDERAHREEAATTLSAELRHAMPKLPIVRLAFIEATEPEAVMTSLARELAPHVDTLLP